MSACTKTPGCLMHAGHKGDCGTLADVPPLVAKVVRKQGLRLANWVAAKILRALGHEVSR